MKSIWARWDVPIRGASGRRRRPSRWILVSASIVFALAAYPAFVVGTAYAYSLGMLGDRPLLPGGRHGPQDAYRHSLASAIVAYTASPVCVQWVTDVMERGGHGSAANAMDAHNNRLGARIGAEARDWRGMLVAVRAAVEAGDVAILDPAARSAPHRIVWLPPERWRNRLY